MSYVENRIKELRDINSKRKDYVGEIEKQKEALNDKLWNMPKDIQKTTADSVLEDLVDISINGNLLNKHFDDPDIKWYLTKYPIDAPAHNKLRESYNKAMGKCRESKGVSLTMWEMEKEDALDLLKEINSYMEKK